MQFIHGVAPFFNLNMLNPYFQLSLTFYSQKEIASRQLRLLPTSTEKECSDGSGTSNMLQGNLNVMRNGDQENILHGETVYFPLGGAFDAEFLEENDALAKRAAAESATSPRRTDKPTGSTDVDKNEQTNQN